MESSHSQFVVFRVEDTVCGEVRFHLRKAAGLESLFFVVGTRVTSDSVITWILIAQAAAGQVLTDE